MPSVFQGEHMFAIVCYVALDSELKRQLCGRWGWVRTTGTW